MISEILIEGDAALSGLLARRIERSRAADESLDWLQRVSKNTSYWSRSEYGSLVKAIEALFRQGNGSSAGESPRSWAVVSHAT